MKISRLQRDITLNQGSSRLHSEPQNYREKNVGAYNDSNRGYSAGFNGSFTGKSEAAVNAMKKVVSLQVTGLINFLLIQMTTTLQPAH